MDNQNDRPKLCLSRAAKHWALRQGASGWPFRAARRIQTRAPWSSCSRRCCAKFRMASTSSSLVGTSNCFLSTSLKHGGAVPVESGYVCINIYILYILYKITANAITPILRIGGLTAYKYTNYRGPYPNWDSLACLYVFASSFFWTWPSMATVGIAGIHFNNSWAVRFGDVFLQISLKEQTFCDKIRYNTYITLHYITLHCIALHCITLHYITLHTYVYVYLIIWIK